MARLQQIDALIISSTAGLAARRAELQAEEATLSARIAAAHAGYRPASARASPPPQRCSSPPLQPRAASEQTVAWLRSCAVRVLLRPAAVAPSSDAPLSNSTLPLVPSDLSAADAAALSEVAAASAKLLLGFASERNALVASSAAVLESLEATARVRSARDARGAAAAADAATMRAAAWKDDEARATAKFDRRVEEPAVRLAAARAAAHAAEALATAEEAQVRCLVDCVAAKEAHLRVVAAARAVGIDARESDENRPPAPAPAPACTLRAPRPVID